MMLEPIKRIETYIYVLIGGLVACCHLVAGYILPNLKIIPASVEKVFSFGFSQLEHLPAIIMLLWYLITIIVIYLYHHNQNNLDQAIRNLSKDFFSYWWLPVIIAVISIPVFFLLRSQYLNQDAIYFADKFAQDVPAYGAHVTHDEMWELYLHSRFWFYTNHYFGWTVPFSYQILSCAAGGGFILLILFICRMLLPEKAFPLFLLIISGAFVQLFFGDVENYTLTTMWIAGYYLTALLFIKDRLPVYIPALILAIAMTFHLLAGFLLPSLVYLYLLALKRKQYRSMLAGSMLFILVVVGTLVFLDNNGLPIRNLYYRSFAFGYGGEVKTIVRHTWIYLFDQVNLLFLLFPMALSIFPLIFFRRISLDPLNCFLITASLFMLLLFFFWKSAIGLYDDWNLFANSALILSILVWYNLLKSKFPYRNQILIAMFSISFLHTASWVISNHFY